MPNSLTDALPLSKGGFYEQFMGDNGYLTISEIPSRGNSVLKEYSPKLNNTR